MESVLILIILILLIKLSECGGGERTYVRCPPQPKGEVVPMPPPIGDYRKHEKTYVEPMPDPTGK